jgi:hypothetical protein
MHHILDGTALDFVRSLGSPPGFDRVSAPWVELDRYLPEFPGDSASDGSILNVCLSILPVNLNGTS